MTNTLENSGSRQALGLASIGFAVAFNVPFSVLASSFDYPDVLRRPAGEVLALFHAGGASLILTWHAFALMALALGPLAVALSIRQDRLARSPALAVGAALAGGLAALAQAIGLWRWVFVVPSLAATYVDPGSSDAARATAESAFTLINLYGGVAIGEHIGQLLTALFALLLASMQMKEGARLTALVGFAAAGSIAIGTNEGLSIALGNSGALFGTVTVVGFLALTLWLLATGFGLLRRPVPAAAIPAAS